jgi:hypothetical protein
MAYKKSSRPVGRPPKRLTLDAAIHIKISSKDYIKMKKIADDMRFPVTSMARSVLLDWLDTK